MKKTHILFLLILSMQSISMYAAQESPHNVENGRQTMIDNAVTSFRYLTDGFDFLRTQNLVDTSFHDFLEQHVSHDEDGNEDMNFDQVIVDAEDVLTKNMKDAFLKTLDTSLQKCNKFGQFDDPVFLYVMQHKDDNLYRLWLHEWNNIKNKWDGNGLYGAALKNNEEIVSMLIAAGVDLNIQNDYHRRTALHKAASYNYGSIVEMLINAGARLNIQDYNSETPLHKAVLNNHSDVVAMLIAKGADLNIQNDDDNTALHWAARKNHKEIAEILIAAQADLNIQNKSGDTALHWAARYNYKGIVDMLIAARAHLNTQNKSMDTALHKAALNNHIQIVKMLIAAGADLNIQNDYDNTPLHLAAKKNHTEIAEILIAAHADLNIQNKYSKTAQQLAKTPEIKEIFAQAREIQHEKMDTHVIAPLEQLIKKDS